MELVKKIFVNQNTFDPLKENMLLFSMKRDLISHFPHLFQSNLPAKLINETITILCNERKTKR